MPMLSRLLLYLVFGTAAASVTLPVQAAPSVPAASSTAASQVQIDGITARVVDKLWNQTDEYWHDGDYPRIVALDRVITQADPQFLEAYSNGGWIMDSLGRTGDAEAYYKLGITNNPHAAYAYWNLGFFYFNTTKDYAKAAHAFEMDTRQPDADLNDWKMRGHAEEKARQWDKAVATWRTIKAKWPNGLGVDRQLREAEQKRAAALGSGKL